MSDNPEIKGREAAKMLPNEVFYNDMDLTFGLILNNENNDVKFKGFMVRYLESGLTTRAKMLDQDESDTAPYFARGLKETVKLLPKSPRSAYSFFHNLILGPSYNVQYC